ncbi:DUF6776 family protein [Povalibacter sp.]|uniref:DUF6776 family protein n=1 Tax=Povalibacter sp. TaxID=1962978 RepID=UPI002F41AE7F
MADTSGMRTGQFVIRTRPQWQRRLLLVSGALAALLLLYVAYETGRFQGGYSKFAEIQRRRELTSQMETLREANEKLKTELAAAELARNVEKQAYAEVEKSLSGLQSQVLKHREELTFYRGIVAPEDGIGGLRVQGFQVSAGGAENHYHLQLVLLQSMRQDTAASGVVSIAIEGVRNNAAEVLPLSQIGGETRADGSVEFKFRYFQEIDQDIVLPPDFEPRAVTVEVRSGRLAPVKESYPWQVQAQS